MNTPNLTLIGHIWPATTTSMSILRAIALALFGSLLVAACAQVSIPMIPVPMTLQTLAVLTVGGAYGARLGAFTLALYALEGVSGLPVFANGQAGVFLPDGTPIASGGYIIGFVIAAGLVGYLCQRGWDRNAFKMFAAMLLGAAIIYVPGLIWLATWFVETKGMAWNDAPMAAVTGGLVNFIWGDVIKAILAALAFPATWLAVDRR
jgi:biotin transport system substrate-specific component